MIIDGKRNVKNRTKIFENNNFVTYLYEFENGKSYKDTVNKWVQTDFGTKIRETQEEKIEKQTLKKEIEGR